MGTAEEGSPRDRILNYLGSWPDRAGYSVERHQQYDDLVASTGRELRLSGDRELSVSTVEPESLLIRSTDEQVVVKFLLVSLGPAIRVREHIAPELVVRYTDPPRGWQIERTGGAVVLRRSGAPVAVLGGDTSHTAAVTMCHAVESSDAFIRASFRHPRGSRLFSPVDYYSREIPSGQFSHAQADCEGPTVWPSLSLGVSASGWSECVRCLWCGKYWTRSEGNPGAPMTRAEFDESLPWEPPGSFGQPIPAGGYAGAY